MSVIYAGRVAYDPRTLRDSCLRATPQLPIDLFWGVTNRFEVPLGEKPGTGKILLAQDDLSAIDLTTWHDLRWWDQYGNEHTLQKITLVKAECVSPGLEGGALNVFVCDLADRRFHLARGAVINKGYNVSTPDGTGYLAETLNSGSAWTWQEIVQDLFTILALGTAPTLSPTPDGTPENLTYFGEFAWRALNNLMTRLARAIKYDPIEDTFTIVRLGDAGNATAASAVIDTYYPDRVWDAYAVDPAFAWMPETIRVLFPRRPLPENGCSPWYPVDVSTGNSTALANTTIQLNDDLTAVFSAANETTPTNSANLTARASERAADWQRKRAGFDSYFLQVYVGHKDDANEALSGVLSHVEWQDRGLGAVTMGRRQPDRALEAWERREQIFPSLSGSGGTTVLVGNVTGNSAGIFTADQLTTDGETGSVELAGMTIENIISPVEDDLTYGTTILIVPIDGVEDWFWGVRIGKKRSANLTIPTYTCSGNSIVPSNTTYIITGMDLTIT